jgi:hypothetical protein
MRSACDDPDTELFCSDTGAEGGQESATVTLDPGVYYLFIDGWNSRDDESLSDGDYTLEYSFHTNPCADESAACPGEPLCVAAADWSAYECTCPTAGEVLFEGSCVADPCNPNPCGDLEHGVCSPDLAAGSYECVCGGIYVDDGASGCVLATDAEWTIFWYLAMDNNLYYQTAHELDDVMAAGFSPDVRVVALVDRLDEPRGYYGEFGPASVDRVVELGEPDTGNWETSACGPSRITRPSTTRSSSPTTAAPGAATAPARSAPRPPRAESAGTTTPTLPTTASAWPPASWPWRSTPSPSRPDASSTWSSTTPA